MLDTTTDIEFLLNDFGVTVTYTKGGDSKDIIAIFDNTYEAIDIGGGVPFAMAQPRLYTRTSDLPLAADGDIITIQGVDYIVRVVMPDGTGVTELQVEKQ